MLLQFAAYHHLVTSFPLLTSFTYPQQHTCTHWIKMKWPHTSGAQYSLVPAFYHSPPPHIHTLQSWPHSVYLPLSWHYLPFHQTVHPLPSNLSPLSLLSRHTHTPCLKFLMFSQLCDYHNVFWQRSGLGGVDHGWGHLFPTNLIYGGGFGWYFEYYCFQWLWNFHLYPAFYPLLFDRWWVKTQHSIDHLHWWL